MRSKKVRFKKRFYVFVVVLIAAIVIGGIAVTKNIQGGGTSNTQTSDKVSFSITCAGDLVMHGPVLNSCKTSGGYDFTKCFRYIKPYISKADMSFCSLEAPLVKSGYTGYPVFRSPDGLAISLKKVGFDTVLTSSNHTFDAGESGMLRTIKVLKKAGLKVEGSRLKKSDPRYQMTKIKGVKVAIVSYVYGGGSAGTRDLNGNKLTAKGRQLINTFGYKTFDKDLVHIKATVNAARKAGAKIVIMYYHWGNEYQTHSDAAQRSIAKKTIKAAKVNIIVASHPHVVQEHSVIKRDDGSKVSVYYAMGNLLSNQRREWMDGDVHVEEGTLVRLHITYDKGKKKLVSFKDSTMPYWLDYYGSGPTKYTLIPLDSKFRSNKELRASGHVSRAAQAKKNIENILKAK